MGIMCWKYQLSKTEQFSYLFEWVKLEAGSLKNELGVLMQNYEIMRFLIFLDFENNAGFYPKTSNFQT